MSFAMQHMDGHGCGFKLGQDNLQLPRSQVCGNLIGQQPGNPEPLGGGLDRSVVGVDGQPGFDPDGGLSSPFTEFPFLCGGDGGRGNEGMA